LVDLPVGGGAVDGLGELRSVPVGSIEPNRYQPRRQFDEEALGALAESVRELGVLQPVLVRPVDDGRYELIAGERRWRASLRAGLRMIPALVRDSDDLGSLEQAIVENLHRQDLSPLEEAAAYQELIADFGLTQEKVAQRVGKSRSAVTNTLRLLQLPVSVQRLVGERLLSAGHARALLSLSDADEQRALADRIIEQELSVRQAEEAAKSLVRGDVSPTGPGSRSTGGVSDSMSAAELEVRSLLEDRLETRVEVQQGSRGGRLVIRFADNEDLDRIVQAVLAGDDAEGPDAS
jgi:ParB family chromosome partitioning protein